MRIALVTDSTLPQGADDDQPLAESLRARGAQVDFVDWQDASIAWEAFGGALLRSTWDYTEHYPAYLAWIERVADATRLFHGPKVVRWNTHKSYLREIEGEAPIVPTCWIDRGAQVDLARECAERGWNHAVLKPQVGATAREAIHFRTEGEELEGASAHLERLVGDEDMMLQPFLSRVAEVGELSIVVIDGECAHAYRKDVARGEWRVQTDFGGKQTPVELTDDWRASAERACQAASQALALEAPLLYARVDLLPGDGGEWWLNELELVEPELYLDGNPGTAERLASALLARIEA